MADNKSINANLKYFGFTIVDSGFDYPDDGIPKTNYIDEVYEFSNIADIHVTDSSDDISARLINMSSYQVKAVVSVQNVFFETFADAGYPSGMHYVLYSNYIDRWNYFVTNSKIEDNIGRIRAFYIADEPYHSGTDSTELQSACDLIKQKFDKPILLIEAYTALDSLIIPDSVDWIGFDMYGVYNPYLDTDYNDNLAKLRSKKSSNNQKIIIVLESQWYPDYLSLSGVSKEDMADVAENYYKLASANDDVIGILCYPWPGKFDHTDQVGGREMPQSVKDVYNQIGKSITSK